MIKRIFHSTTLFLIVLALFLITYTTFAQERVNNIVISKEEYQDQWPFTVDTVNLACVRHAANSISVYISTEDTKFYGLNGISRSKLDLPEPYPIWRDNPQIPGAKISIGSLILRGLEMCQ